MESATKNKQDNETIIKMVQKAFPDQDDLTSVKVKELTEGFFNVAYEIQLSGRQVILKIAPPKASSIMSYEKNIMKAEVDSLRLIREKTDVPVPQMLFYDDTRTICDADYFFMEKLEGDSFYKLKCNGMSQEEQDRILCEIGCLNRKMNQVTGQGYGYLGQPDKIRTNWRETFLSMISDVLSDGERVEISLGMSYRELRNLIDKAGDALEQVGKPSFVHWDLWDGNVFVKDGRITGIIDFERALWGDPLMEAYFRSHSYHDKFNDGYGENLRAKAPVRALLYDIYLYLIMVIETKYRNYPDDGQYHFAVNELKASVEKLSKII
jgi:aminoglycoside phosphotransferase (APT) family kinase protein